MHAKYQVAIFNIAKVRAMLKFSDGQTDGQFKNYMPPYRGHTKLYS